ncbi:CDP-diacylglycerol--serine O-phosphatidyltransferase [Aeromonas sp. sif2433]|uniref:CDP-diacylglycerol--serine O-phosphatidyltransferase n=1 Tax=Aeromonas sp. sif2433 TaxID=2854794 RepID=UPI001C46D814|nr:CDP-diacylglycerol--serine O-phosphatidyltransferase [Aeromonas sp. sif2433]MBV7416268.1 CDP-diacylglycerol--serine O-phosphatidyltransferase [Aeromonas sp. sif2433]
MHSSAHYRQLLTRLPQIAVPADRFQVLGSAKEFKSRILSLIASATQRIYLVALYLQDDEAGREILSALYAAKQRNPALDIKLFVDFHRAQRGLIGKGKQGGNHLMYQEMAARHEHQIAIYGVPVKGRELLGVLHLKGFIFDDTLLYSGASLNDIYLHQQERYRFDRYHQITSPELTRSMVNYVDDVFLRSEAVQRLDRAEIPSAKLLKGPIRRFKHSLRTSQYRFKSTLVGAEDVAITPMAGLGKRGNQLNRMIRNLVRATEREIFICTPYFNPPKELNKDVEALLKRGCKVTIVVGDKTANDFFIPPEEKFSTIGGLPYLYETNLRRFAERNQRHIDSGRLNLMLWCCEKNSYHLKGIFVDEEWALLTGNNLNPRAWALDLENGLLVHDQHRHLRERFAEERANILAHARRISHFDQIEQIKDYPEQVRKLLARIHRVRAHILLKRII